MHDADNFILTKILATLGPATGDVATVKRLIEEGARVFRINFSHGSFESFTKLLHVVRQASEETGIHCGALGDLCGPKIRVGKVVEGGIALEPGDRFEFQAEPIVAGSPDAPPPLHHDSKAVFSVTVPDLVEDVLPGQRLLINDGETRAIVVERLDEGGVSRLLCNTTIGGVVSSGKGVNLPDTDLSLPAITDYDWQCVDWAVEHEIDFLALSFVREADDVRELKAGLDQRGAHIPIVSKIEKPQAIGDLDGIMNATDGIMVARGDLGVEMDLEQVPVIQKQLVLEAHRRGKPVIVATQMLQSMIESAYPTRAEVSDVANAIFDSADAVMLSGETAVGKFPVQSVRMMAKIAETTQHHLAYDASNAEAITIGSRSPVQESRYRPAALATGVASVVRDIEARMVVTWSHRGGSAAYLSRTRLNVPIIAASNDPATLRRMSLYFGVIPVYLDQPDSIESFTHAIDQLIRDHSWALPGDPVVIAAGRPLDASGITNTLVIHYVGERF